MALSLVIFALDATSKWWLISEFDIAAVSPLEITPFFDLVMVWNPGISFGLLHAGSFAQTVMLIIAATLLVLVLLVWLARSDGQINSLALGLVIGGAAGNIIDRAINGAVADFFSFHVAGFHWPAFNVSDMAISVGVVILLVQSFRSPAH